MNGPLAAAGALALVAAAIHGIVGDWLLRKLARDALSSERVAATRVLIRVSWHFVTVTFLVSGCALLYVAFLETGAPPMLLAFLGVLYTLFAVYAVAVGYARRGVGLARHPAPYGLTAIAGLIWWAATGT